MSSGSLELDSNTRLENSLIGLSLLSAVVGFCIVFYLTMQKSVSPSLSTLFYLSMASSVIFGVLRYLLAERHVLDFDKKRLVLRRDFCGGTSEKVICQLEDIESVVIDGKMVQGKYSRAFAYGLLLVKRNGQTVRVFSVGENSYAHRRTVANFIAHRLGIGLTDCPPDLLAGTCQVPENPTLESISEASAKTLFPNISAAVLISLLDVACLYAYFEFV